jgi:hypothetical protein
MHTTNIKSDYVNCRIKYLARVIILKVWSSKYGFCNFEPNFHLEVRIF